MAKRGLLSVFFICLLMNGASGQTLGAVKDSPFQSGDLNYHYSIRYIGWVTDFANPASDLLNLGEVKSTPTPEPKDKKFSRKIFIELDIESVYGGFDWLPLNPLISDNANRILSDYKVIAGPPAGDVRVTLIYLISVEYKDVKSVSLYEEGISQNGGKAYRMSLRRILVDNSPAVK